MGRILHIRDFLPVPDAEILVVYARALRWRGCAVLSDRGVEYPHRADPRRSAIRNDAQCADGIEQAGEDLGVVLYTAMVRLMHTLHIVYVDGYQCCRPGNRPCSPSTIIHTLKRRLM